jgi:FG-GAP repeat protein
MGVGDYNGDGRADILLQSSGGEVAIWEMNGTSIIGGGVIANPGPTWHV